MALDRAPGLTRERFGFNGWGGHDEGQWRAIFSEANERARAGAELPSKSVVTTAIYRRSVARNITSRDWPEQVVRIRCKDLASLKGPLTGAPSSGLLAVNPPWGERMGDVSHLPRLYSPWRGHETRIRWMAEPDSYLRSLAGKSGGLQASHRHRFHNGRLNCTARSLIFMRQPLSAA